MTKTEFTRLSATSLVMSSLVFAGCSDPVIGGGGSGGAPTGAGGAGTAAAPGTGGAGSTTGTGGGPMVVDTNGDGRPDCVPGIFPTSQIPRLQALEYDNTIRDLLGLTGLAESNNNPPSSLLATDQDGALTDLGWSSYQTVAEMIASQVMADSTMKAKFMSCDAATPDCINSTITAFGRRAFRRALLPEEITLFQALNNAELTETGTPDEIAELVLYGFLVSPMFLMRTELAQTTNATAGQLVLSPQEIASRLSYMLWGSMPDPILDEAADTGQLATKEQILAQAKRMLTDDKARTMVADFHREYLHIQLNSRWDTYVKDETLFPEFTPELRSPLTSEVEMFFDQTVFGDGSFQDLLTSTSGFVNAQTAGLYGVAAPAGTDLAPTDLPGRPGFLTRIGWLAAYSAAYRTSPIVRGAFIVKDVLGITMAAPPPGAAQTALPDDPALDTNRKRVDAQTQGGTCITCHHQYINPHGFVMEAFDTLGRPQTTESDTGAAINTAADVWIDGAAVPIAEPVALMTAIANSTDAQYYYAQKWVGYGFDRTPNSQDACIVETLSASIAAGDYRILDLISDMTQSDTFTVRTVEGASP